MASAMSAVLPRPVKIGFLVEAQHKAVLQHQLVKVVNKINILLQLQLQLQLQFVKVNQREWKGEGEGKDDQIYFV